MHAYKIYGVKGAWLGSCTFWTLIWGKFTGEISLRGEQQAPPLTRNLLADLLWVAHASVMVHFCVKSPLVGASSGQELCLHARCTAFGKLSALLLLSHGTLKKKSFSEHKSFEKVKFWAPKAYGI